MFLPRNRREAHEEFTARSPERDASVDNDAHFYYIGFIIDLRQKSAKLLMIVTFHLILPVVRTHGVLFRTSVDLGTGPIRFHDGDHFIYETVQAACPIPFRLSQSQHLDGRRR